MAKLVDAPASGAGDRKVVEVRVLFWAPIRIRFYLNYDSKGCSSKMVLSRSGPVETIAIGLPQISCTRFK